MKKISRTVLAMAIAGTSLSAIASGYAIRSPVKVGTINWSSEVSYSDWEDVGDKYGCENDIEKDDVYYAKSATQIETCKQDQERVKTTVRTNTLGYSETSTETEEQTEDVEYENEIVGTHLEGSCKEALAFDNELSTGSLVIELSNGTKYSAYCDMSTDGGGWTRLDNSVLSNTTNFSKTSKTYAGLNYSVTSDDNTYHVVGHESGSSAPSNDVIVNVDLNMSYSQFRFESYKARDYSQQSKNSYDINGESLKSVAWSTQVFPGSSSYGGDIAFGTSDNSYPTVSYRSQGQSLSGYHVNFGFNSTSTFDNGKDSSTLSFRMTERGTQDERVIFWYSGYIWVR